MSEPMSSPTLGQINIVVRDMRKSVAFYRLLGLSIDEIPIAEWAPHHASGVAPNGVRVELDSVAFAKQWNPVLDESKLGSSVIPFLLFASRADVDGAHERVIAAGYRSQKAPEDAFWGARYAIVEDPDGNSVGLMSPIEESMRRAPPHPPGNGLLARLAMINATVTLATTPMDARRSSSSRSQERRTGRSCRWCQAPAISPGRTIRVPCSMSV